MDNQRSQNEMHRLDHVLVRVDNIEEAVNKYSSAGFKVYLGSRGKKCYNGMIYFKNNTFIELVDQSKFPGILKFLAKKKILNKLGIMASRMALYAASDNFYLDYAVYNSSIGTFHETVKALVGKKVSKPMDFKRTDFFGHPLEWSLFAFDDLELPFVISDYKPVKLPEETAVNHPNGAVGIEHLIVETTAKHSFIARVNKAFKANFSEDKIELENSRIILKESSSFRIDSVFLEFEGTGRLREFREIVS
ncbi:MAG: VOC family protein [Spirochaetales bacterium]|nr:VOC family protein [Spirochaetales bacterium]